MILASYFSLPDMTAIQDKEIEIPTLHMEPMTLSGIINEHIATIDSGEINRLLHTDTQAQQSQAQQVYLPPTTNYTVSKTYYLPKHVKSR